jgi:hypothetical protein
MQPEKDVNRHLLICNGASVTATGRRGSEWANARVQELWTHPRCSNVTLKITDITNQMVKKLSPLVEDLVEISALVYAADQACRRVYGRTFDYATKWFRRFRFEIAVREPDFWNRQDVNEALSSTLGFLSDDHYEFAFTKYSDAPNFGDYLEFKKGAAIPPRPKRVMLFSGGLDSLAGAAEEVFIHDRRVALVSHKPVDHLAVKQSDLVKEIQRRAKGIRPGLAPLHFAVKANKDGELTVDNTQRSRSFLYAAMAMAVADVFELDDIYFYENGVVSVNLPLCGQEVGGRATRTTHPQVLHGLGKLFSLVLDRGFKIHNEYLWDTKEDVLRRLLKSNHADLARQSFSCIHTRLITHSRPHCGLCSQCISRWIASLGAEYGDNDPASRYGVDVLTGERKRDEDRILAERYIGLSRRVAAMTTADEFHLLFALELARTSPYVGLSERVATAKLFDLHWRHANQVNRAIENPMLTHIQDLLRYELPDTCTLAYAFDPRQADVKHLQARDQKVRLQGPGKPVLLEGKEKPALSKTAYAVVEALVKANGAGLKKAALEKVCGDARGVLKRLAKSDKDWRAVIHFPKSAGRGYRID